MTQASLRETLRLLKPHALPYLWALVAVVVLGGISAFGQRFVFLLLEPTWEILYPDHEQTCRHCGSPIDLDCAACGEPILGEKESALQQGKDLRDGVLGWWIGPTADLAPDRRFPALLRVASLVGALALLIAVSQFAFIWLGRWVALRMVVSLRMLIARHLMGLSLRYHGQRHFGDMLSRVSSDVTTTLVVIQQGLRDLIQEPLLGVISIVMASILAPRATLLVIIGLPLLAIPVSLLMKRVRKGSRKSATELGASVQVLTQMFQGIRTVKAFRAEEREIERYSEVNESYLRKTMKMVRAIALSSAWTSFYSHAGLGVLLIAAGFLSLRTGELSNPGTATAFFLLIATVYSNIKATTKALTRAQESVGASTRLIELLQQPADIVEKDGAVALGDIGDGVRFEGVSYSYPGGDGPAVSGIDLEVRRGETLALVGPSGSGKSTLLDLIARFIDPDEGRVTAGGRDLRELTLDSWTSCYAMVGQVPFLFHASIEENIAYGDPRASHEEVVAAARAAGIHDFIEGLPDGYRTSVADAGSRLSGGQRQRITIARAFLKQAPLLLLDEATSALDPESEAVVQEALERLMADRTVIVIAHRLSTVRNADRIAVLEAGRLVELGTHAVLLERDGVYARMHTAQMV